jgi:signal transduction histidine kinase
MKKNKFVFYLMLVLVVQSTFAQGDMLDKWKYYATMLKEKQLNEEAYLQAIDSLVILRYTESDFQEKLEIYRELAWKKKERGSFRASYFRHLANHTTMTDKGGASIYYLQKMEAEKKKLIPYFKSFSVERGIMQLYHARGSYQREIEYFNSYLPELKAVPAKMDSEIIPVATIKNILIIYNLAALNYKNQQKSDSLSIIKKLVNEWEVIIQNNQDRYFKLNEFVKYVRHMVLYCIFIVDGDVKQCEENLLALLDIIYHENYSTEPWKITIKSEVLNYYIDFLIKSGKLENIDYYMDLLKKEEAATFKHFRSGELFYELSAEIMALKGDYKEAYEGIKKLYRINDSIIGIKTADINNNLYAQAEAEFHKLELDREAKEKKQVKAIFIITLTILLAILSYVYINMRRKGRQAREQIRNLQLANLVQITELEEKAKLIKQEEQKRLSADLHDGLSGSIANVKAMLEVELLSIEDKNLRQKLKRISDEVTDIYEIARGKSHEWFALSESETEEAFYNRIMLLVDTVFPEEKYQREVLIESNSMLGLELGVKIELLYIIQEAITNIIKYANANAIQLLIFRENEVLNLEIIDNGVGFNEKVKNGGMGLENMRKRARKLNGYLEITSEKNETRICVNIPVSLDILQEKVRKNANVIFDNRSLKV